MNTSAVTTIGASEIAAPAFDYSKLPSAVATDVRDATSRIRAVGQAHSETVIAIGRDLAFVKEQLKHGQYQDWLRAEFGMEPRTAQRYVQAAGFADGKNDIVSHLEPTAIYLLSAPSTPSSARELVTERIRSGEWTPTETIKEIIAQAKDEHKEIIAQAKDEQERQRDAAKFAAMPAKKQKKIRDHKKEIEEERAEWERKEKARHKETEALADLLVDRFNHEAEMVAEMIEKAHPHNIASAIRANIAGRRA
jgi:hypothetical protein